MPIRRAKKGSKPKPAKPAAPKRFGRSGTAGKGEGAEAVKAWIADVKRTHRPMIERLDAIITEEVPKVRKAVKWSMPFYGLPGIGWFASIGAFKDHVSLNFFSGTKLRPVPPEGESHQMRRVNIADPSKMNEKQIRAWVRQASVLPGWGTV